LLSLCVLVWMAIRAQGRLDVRNRLQQVGLGSLVVLALVFHFATIREILSRGWITEELSATGFAKALPPGSLQVFGNNPPRLYMLLNDLLPAYAYLFVYDTNQDLVIWDTYRTLIDAAPPDYIAVEDDFSAVEYGQQKSTELTDAASVRTWIDERASYQKLEVGRSLGLTMYRRRD
jgi:hypothetical protein